MGDRTLLDRVIELEAGMRVIKEELARLYADFEVQKRQFLGTKTAVKKRCNG